MGRPTLCTPATVDALCTELEGRGTHARPCTLAEACRRVGVPERTVRFWRTQPALAARMAQIDDARQALKAHLLERVADIGEAATKAETAQLNALLWQLSKLFPTDFARTEVLQRKKLRAEIDATRAATAAAAGPVIQLRWPDETDADPPADAAPAAAPGADEPGAV
jgi:hypothetical protein